MPIRGVGCDVCKVSRIQRLMESRFAPRFLQKAFHAEEIRDCQGKDGFIYEKLASRWAAKEAAYKALQLETFSPRFYEMWVCKSKNQSAPKLVLLGETKLACERERVGALHLSLSHDTEYCFATVVCEQKPL